MYKSSQGLKPEILSKFVEYIYNTFDFTYAKDIVNKLIGSFGCKYKTKNDGFTSSELDDVLATWYENKDKKILINEINGMYLVKVIKESLRLRNHTSIMRFVIDGGVREVINYMYEINKSGMKVCGVSTDCIMCYTDYECEKKEERENTIDNIGKIFEEKFKRLPNGRGVVDSIPDLKYKYNGKGKMFIGVPGCGKSTELINMVREDDLVLCYTNKACQNLRDKGCNKVKTFDSYFAENVSNEVHINMLKGKRVLIDEFCMVPNKWICLLYQAWIKWDIEVLLFGDNNQCDPVDINIYDYVNSLSVKQMVGNNIEVLEYKGYRYDEKMYEILVNYQRTGILEGIKKSDIPYNRNICYRNSTRKEVNTKICEKYGGESIWFKPDNMKYKVKIGTPVIALNNLKEINIYNNQMFEVVKIDEKNVVLTGDIIIPMKVFKNDFTVAYCVTVYKYQGGEIDQDYNIYDVDEMDKKMMYTALSRTTKWEYVHLNGNNYIFETRKNQFRSIGVGFNKWKDCLIYKISSDNDNVYIGMTCKTLDERLREHKKDKKSLVYNFDNPKIELVVECPCFSMNEAEYYEKRYINKFDCVNKRGKFVEKKVKVEYSIKNNDEIKEKLRNGLYKICENKDSYRITYTVDKKRKDIKKVFGKDKNRAYEKIKMEQDRLIDEYLN